MIRRGSNIILPARLPDGPLTFFAIVYNGGEGDEPLKIRAFEDEAAAWKYGEIMAIAPIKITVAKVQGAKLKPKLRVVA